jgi:PAS domain-containing protein
MLIGRDRRIRYFNRIASEAALAMWGSELTRGQSIDDLVFPTDRGSFEVNFARALGGEAMRVEKCFPGDSGARHFDFRYSPVQVDGAVTGVFFDVSEITERRRAEEALARSADFTERVFNSTDVRLAVVRPDGIIEGVNAAWRRFDGKDAGRDERASDVGASYFVPVDESWGDTALAHEAFEGIRAVQRGDRADFSLEYPCREPNGETRWFMMRVCPLQGVEGTVLVSHTDVTSIKQAEESVRETEELLSEFLRHSPVYAYVKEVDEGASRVIRARQLQADGRPREPRRRREDDGGAVPAHAGRSDERG